MFSLSHLMRFFIFALCSTVSSVAFAQQTNPCVGQNTIKVVVLGSSTAAGSGVSTSDSAWVNRYRNYLQSINANNEVINLAVGGYTTYKIMPTAFVPPAGRPTPNPAKNITAALALNPDAIIVNMPSNDVSNGFSYQEQIDNFDSLVAVANTNSVPIWICTTQPKNFSNPVLRQLQHDIKDSILQFYAPNTLDFWTTIALPDHSIDPFYDSGDGTHVNDAAHHIFNDRVIAADIPTAVYLPNLMTPDYSVIDLSHNGDIGCGDSTTVITLVLANLGVSNMLDVDIVMQGTNTTSGQTFTDTLIQIGGLSACTTDTLTFTINTYDEGTYDVLAFSTHAQDTTTANDSLLTSLKTLGHPTLIPIHDTICSTGTGQLSVIQNAQDTVFWYALPSDTTAIASGPNFSPGSLTSTTTYYAESIRGDLFYRDELSTTLTSTTNWNGAMFDLIAHENLMVDSFYVKANTLGSQQVEIYTKIGTHIGFQTNPTPWTLLGTTTLNVTDITNFTQVPIGNFALSFGDTIGVYMQMVDPNAKISYRSVSSPINHSTSEIEIITGSGVSNNFSNSYYPRELNCGVHYHFGNRPEGDCSTGKIPVTVHVNNSTFSLGNDTIIDIADTLTLTCPSGFPPYYWSNGETTATIDLSANTLGQGVHFISVSFIDSLGCLQADTIVIAIADLVGLSEIHNDFYFYPNPTSDGIQFSSNLTELNITNSLGQRVEHKTGSFDSISLAHLPDGIYFLELHRGDLQSFTKLIKKAKY